MPHSGYDVIVVGLGAMGSATLAELARRGRRVLGLERYRPPHAMGSSHGESRIIRQAYMEHPDYVPLARRAYELWETWAERSGLDLITQTGGLMIGTADSHTIQGTLESARIHALAVELLDRRAMSRRFPPFCLEEGQVAVYEPAAGVLRPELAISAFLLEAALSGATLQTGETVTGMDRGPDRWTVQTDQGTYEADQVVLTVGAWLGDLIRSLGLANQGPTAHLSVERQVPLWFRPSDITPFLIDRFPIYVWELRDGASIYGFPSLDQRTVKGAFHHGGDWAPHPDAVDRNVRREDRDRYLRVLGERLPQMVGEWDRGSVCLYTNTRDEHFVVDRVPGETGLFLAGGFSGHGFKFAPVIGEALADLVTEGKTALPIGFLSAGRTGLPARAQDREGPASLG